MTTLELYIGGESRLAALARRVARTLRTWRDNARARRELARISPRDLADAGVSVCNAQHELARPFWRPLSDLRG
ncbi:MAG: DUF1127 domain-containing protein [Candidatus Lambdaproteobacteria bacterium]|nr:DUF1127 domain-containing protein [Candidatus Lambdaproteobacteria bacterium]